MKVTALLGFMLATTAFAHGSFGTEKFSVSEAEFSSAPCRREAPTVAGIEKFLSRYDRSPLQNKTVKGLLLVNQPRPIVSAFEKIIDRAGNLPTNFPTATNCADVRCAVTAIWGEELGLKLLYMKLRFGFNGSELGKKRSKRYSIPQINNVIAALSDLPASLDLTRGMDKGLVLTTETRAGVAGDASLFSGIRLFTGWSNYPDYVTTQWTRYAQQGTIVHEAGHVRGFRSPYGHGSSEWGRVRKTCVVSAYGQTNKLEDYAETFRAYRYNGRELQQHCPQKYAFMKDKVFNGIEYLDEASCR